MLLENFDRYLKDQYDFFYLPIDFKNKCNMGYAFINFTHPYFVVEFYLQFNAKKWECFNSDKICKVTYGRIQGKMALENNFANMNVPGKNCVPEDKGYVKTRPFCGNLKIPDHDWIQEYKATMNEKVKA